VAEQAEPGSTKLFSVVSAAAARMTRDPERVSTVAIGATLDLGFGAAAFRVLEDDSLEHRLLEAVGLDEQPDDRGSMSAELTDRVLQRGSLVVARRTPRGGDEAPLSAGPGELVAAVAAPIWIEGWIAAVLIGAATADASVSPETIEAFGLLGSQAGLSLENAQRIEEGRQTAGRLEQGDRLKTDFLTTISHELRTPLTALMGNGQVLERSWPDLTEEERLDLVRSLNAHVEELDDAVTNLLDFARLEAGELWVSFEPFDVGRTLRAALARSTAALAERRLVTEIEEGLLASGDAVQIRRVVTHLLTNAGVHTPSGTTVTVSCERRGDEILVTVADDGPGIAEADLPFLGERFFRGGELNVRPRGVGLGLALTTGILELHGSTLSIENGPDGGASFSFVLPSVADPAAAGAEVPPSHDGPGHAVRHGRA
jgi:K+-sensing histidine kinase KdpD